MTISTQTKNAYSYTQPNSKVQANCKQENRHPPTHTLSVYPSLFHVPYSFLPIKNGTKKRGTRLLSFHVLRSSHYPDVGTDNAKPTSNISYNDDYIICAKSVPNQRRHNHGYLHPIGHLSLLGS